MTKQWYVAKTGNHQRIIADEQTGENIAVSYRSKYADLLASAPDLLSILTRLAEKVKRANDIQHSGVNILAEDWAELYQLQNEAFRAISKAKGE